MTKDGEVAASRATARVRVVATAGHVDHGKSSLIVALTGIDPDRWDEEKRRGLTIDLGYAWCELPSGREIGFVDVPGHERFITNMLAGVGPVPTALFVVAADEGWKPQSQEHLDILDVLGVDAGVVALTKSDLVEPDAVPVAVDAVRERLRGTSLADAPIVPVSSTTGSGVPELRDALDHMLAEVPAPEPARTRLFVDRIFTIKGAGTVVTGTLTGACMGVGDEMALEPAGLRVRIRSLQTHRMTEDRACPVSRVAANLVGVDRDQAARGDVLTRRDAWVPTDVFDAVLRPVQSLARPIGTRGAYKVYAGAAEVEARIRFLGTDTALEPGGRAFVRIRLDRPLVLDPFDRIVIREAGRRATVAGGTVLDVAPPRRAGADRGSQLAARAGASRDELPALMAAERGAVRSDVLARATGSGAADTTEGGGEGWHLRPGLAELVAHDLEAALRAHHEGHPLEEGAPLQRARKVVAGSLRAAGAPPDAELVDDLIDRSVHQGSIVTSATTVRLVSHRIALDEHGDDLERLLDAIGGDQETTPPTVPQLQAAGFDRDMIDAASRDGRIVKIAPELVVTPALFERARRLVFGANDGITVSAFREALGTSRKYAVPMLEHFDRTGVTRRDGDLRFPR